MKGVKTGGAFAPKPHEAGDIIMFAAQPVEIDGDEDWARRHVRAAANAYVRRLRANREKK